VHRRSLAALACFTALAVTLAGCTGNTAVPATVDAVPVAETPEAVPTEPVETPAASPEPSLEPSPEPSPSEKPSPAAPAYDLVAVQKSLTDLGYYLGAADGRRGPALRSAVMAFQKVQGLGPDGAIGAATLQALAAPRKPALAASGPSNRIEVDLTKQVLYVVKGGAVQRILPISSGNGATYTQKDGSTARALTPTGWYKIERRIVGVREADLGTLYDPQYFYRGWAIHGSNSVPAGPASHGCIRVTRADAKWLLSNISIGMSVYLHGGTHVFSAGSSAPGTDTPTGDTPAGTATPAASPQRSTTPASPTPASSSSASPPPAAPSPTPASSAPSPSASPSPSTSRPAGSASPSPSASSTAP
jgi:peptidoglycan hydrolase-like protein with peptidoglycan-binding domain